MNYIIMTTYKKKSKKNFLNIKVDMDSLTMMASYNFIVTFTFHPTQRKKRTFLFIKLNYIGP